MTPAPSIGVCARTSAAKPGALQAAPSAPQGKRQPSREAIARLRRGKPETPACRTPLDPFWWVRRFTSAAKPSQSEHLCATGLQLSAFSSRGLLKAELKLEPEMSEILVSLRRRGALALIAALAMLGGSAGSALAQNRVFNYTFTSPSFSGVGTFIIDAANAFQPGSTLTVNGSLFKLDRTGAFFGYGTNPTLISTMAPPLFENYSAVLPVFTVDGAGSQTGYDLVGAAPQDALGSFNNGFFGAGGFLTSETLTNPAPAPIPGAGLLSWLAAAFAGGGYVVRARLALLRSTAMGWLRRGRASPAGI